MEILQSYAKPSIYDKIIEADMGHSGQTVRTDHCKMQLFIHTSYTIFNVYIESHVSY